VTKTLCVLVLIGVTSMIGYSQETASEYVSPSEAVPRGKAPKMQVQLLNPGEPTIQYAVIFYQGDEAFSGLLEFAEKYQITSAHLPLLEHWMEQRWDGSIRNARCTRRFRSSVSTK
jgi:uncharacterized protein